MSVDAQKNQGNRSVQCAVLTVSDTRSEETDKSGQYLKTALEKEGHRIEAYQIITDDKTVIQTTVEAYLAYPSVEAIILNGGTGISKRDVTFEAVQVLLEKELPGFGELFRYLSFSEDIGTGALLSRAIAGVAHQKIIFSLPGSTGAVRLGLERLILPEIRHIIHELNK